MRTVLMNRSDRVGDGAHGGSYVSCGLYAIACIKQTPSYTIRFINDGSATFHHITALPPSCFFTLTHGAHGAPYKIPGNFIMPNYRRSRVSGGSYFFTVTSLRRRPVLTQPALRQALRMAIQQTRISHPFDIDA